MHNVKNSNLIKCTVASFRNLSVKEKIKDAVIYFWSSHKRNDNTYDEKMQATIDLMSKKFDLSNCEKYEIYTGYLGRYNYLSKSIIESSIKEIEDAVKKSEIDQREFELRYDKYIKDLNFIKKEWQECINEKYNPHFNYCEELIKEKLKNNKTFSDAFVRSVDEYALKHNTNKINGNLYIIEETTWLLSLPLLHLNKPIYLIHVGNDNSAIRALFNQFSNLQVAVKGLFPHFSSKIFMNIADFQLEYRNMLDLGYSYAVENKKAVRGINQFKVERNLSKIDLLKLLDYERSEKELLRAIIKKTPGHVYWLNRDNVYLGCNELQLKHFDLKFSDQVIGKTNYDLLPHKEAEELNKINKSVMETGKPYAGEELATMQNGFGYYLSHKVPLFGVHGDIIGLLGVSVDITDRKKAEKLQLETELQKIKAQEQETFKTIVGQVSHDIRSPLASLQNMVKACKNLPEPDRIALRNISERITDIANNLLGNYKKFETEASARIQKPRSILVSLVLAEILSAKRQKYIDLPIKFNLNIAPDYNFAAITNSVLSSRGEVRGIQKNLDLATKLEKNNETWTPRTSPRGDNSRSAQLHFAFIKVDVPNFKRTIANLINNAVEACDTKTSGEINLKLEHLDEQIKITLQDNGKGIPPEILNKIRNNIDITAGKANGSGIGLAQVRGTLTSGNGKMVIESIVDVGTKTILTFPKIATPSWIAEQIILHKGDTVVILDDDSCIHDIWNERFADYADTIKLKHFTFGNEAVDFINNYPKKQQLFLLSDFELIDQELNGVQIIEKTAMQAQAMLVTSHHESQEVRELAAETNIKILPKQLASEIQIEIETGARESVLTLPKKIELVIIDDDQLLADSVANLFRTKLEGVEAYYNPNHFLKNISKYSKDTIICMDHDFKAQINGFELAQQLHELGFTKLYLFTGRQFAPEEVPDYLTVILKGCLEELDKIIY